MHKLNKKIINKRNNKFINTIEKIRSKNNKNWMDLLRLAYSLNPKKTLKIMKSIFKNDYKINSILKNLKY
jgi:hypothetical protein